jgi:hypothetical protein
VKVHVDDASEIDAPINVKNGFTIIISSKFKIDSVVLKYKEHYHQPKKFPGNSEQVQIQEKPRFEWRFPITVKNKKKNSSGAKFKDTEKDWGIYVCTKNCWKKNYWFPSNNVCALYVYQKGSSEPKKVKVNVND